MYRLGNCYALGNNGSRGIYFSLCNSYFIKQRLGRLDPPNKSTKVSQNLHGVETYNRLVRQLISQGQSRCLMVLESSGLLNGVSFASQKLLEILSSDHESATGLQSIF